MPSFLHPTQALEEQNDRKNVASCTTESGCFDDPSSVDMTLEITTDFIEIFY